MAHSNKTPAGVKQRIFLRADGSDKIGLGHVFRSCALLDMLKEHYECHFFIRTPLPALKEMLLKAGLQVHELPGDATYEEEAVVFSELLTGEELVVLDGYMFKTAYQQFVKARGCKLVCIDDIHAYHFVADLIINHAGGTTAAQYSAEAYTRFLLGTRYALLRDVFQHMKPVIEEERRDEIFISLGGADVNNDAIEVLKLLSSGKETRKCHLVLGAAYRHEEQLQAYLGQSDLNVNVVRNLSADEIFTLMKRCRIAICPPSTVSYEYLTIGGELYLKMTADNQQDIFRFFLEEALAFPLEDYRVDSDISLRSRGRQPLFFDGRSAERLLAAFLELSADKPVLQ